MTSWLELSSPFSIRWSSRNHCSRTPRSRRSISPNPAPAAQAATLLSSILCNLSLSIQNVNSLNISTNCPKQLKKVKALVELGSDIIMLSDIRLGPNLCVVQDLEKLFLYASSHNYKFIHNSSSSSRGAGFLIKANLNLEVLHEFKDIRGNIYGINIRLNNNGLNLISVYGPNNNNHNA